MELVSIERFSRTNIQNRDKAFQEYLGIAIIQYRELEMLLIMAHLMVLILEKLRWHKVSFFCHINSNSNGSIC